MYSGYVDPEDQAKNFDFNDESIRKGFIKKVYSLLCVSSFIKIKKSIILQHSDIQQVQLSVSLGIIALFVYHEPTKVFVRQHPELMWISLAVLLVTMISLACCEGVRRKSPLNLIVLAIFTLAESFMLGVISSRYTGEEIFLAVGITAAVCLALTIFAFQTKIDFTVMGGKNRNFEISLIFSLIIKLKINFRCSFCCCHHSHALWTYCHIFPWKNYNSCIRLCWCFIVLNLSNL